MRSSSRCVRPIKSGKLGTTDPRTLIIKLARFYIGSLLLDLAGVFKMITLLIQGIAQKGIVNMKGI
jgi:hypothetical protein